MTNTNTEITWKARFIVTQDGGVDLPPDRHHLDGPEDRKARDRFLDQLSAVMPPKTLFGVVKEKLKAGEIKTREAADIVILDATHEGERWLIKGNSNASAGYFYLTAQCMGPVQS